MNKIREKQAWIDEERRWVLVIDQEVGRNGIGIIVFRVSPRREGICKRESIVGGRYQRGLMRGRSI